MSCITVGTPTAFSTRWRGAFPGRNPGILARRPTRWMARPYSLCRSSGGTSIDSRTRLRSSFSDVVVISAISFHDDVLCGTGGEGETRTLTESNLHVILNHARLPIPTLPLGAILLRDKQRPRAGCGRAADSIIGLLGRCGFSQVRPSGFGMAR